MAARQACKANPGAKSARRKHWAGDDVQHVKHANVAKKYYAKNIIDYVKSSENDLWKAENIGSLTTKGYEFDISYSFKSSYDLSNVNSISIGYTNISDDNYVTDINFSKYSLNSLKHHLISKLNLKYIKNTGIFENRKYLKIKKFMILHDFQ